MTPPAPSPRPPIRLLLVDDHPLVRDGLRTRLEATPGFQVVAEAGDAATALAALAAHPPDLVLMDVALRGASGIDLTRQILGRQPCIRVVVLSMHDDAQYVVEAIRAGARGYVLKDSPAGEIVAAIDAVMAGGCYYSAGIAEALASPLPATEPLTERENEVLDLLADGLSSKHIARRLDLSVRTVETHRLNIKRKLNLDGSAALVRYAVERRKLKR